MGKCCFVGVSKCRKAMIQYETKAVFNFIFYIESLFYMLLIINIM